MRTWICLLVVLCVALAGGVPASYAAAMAQQDHAASHGVHHCAGHDMDVSGEAPHHAKAATAGMGDCRAPDGAGHACTPGMAVGCGMFHAVAVVAMAESVALYASRSAWEPARERPGAPRSTVPDPRPPRAFS